MAGEISEDLITEVNSVTPEHKDALVLLEQSERRYISIVYCKLRYLKIMDIIKQACDRGMVAPVINLRAESRADAKQTPSIEPYQHV
jgi:hypothetical protein